jgi:hypothetical protein
MEQGSASGVPWGDGLGKGDLGRLGGQLVLIALGELSFMAQIA